MKVTIFEGTPTELAEVFPGYFNHLDTAPVKVEDGIRKEILPGTGGGVGKAAAVYVSREVATSFFRRISMSDKQRQVFLIIRAAHPNAIPSPEIYKKIEYGSSQFAGMMGAFGRRLANTPNFKVGSRLFVEVWDEEMFCMTYRLPEAVLEALKNEDWAN